MEVLLGGFREYAGGGSPSSEEEPWGEHPPRSRWEWVRTSIFSTWIKQAGYLDDVYGIRVTTMMSNYDNILFSVVHSHLVIGSVLIPGARSPKLVTKEMVGAMQPGTVIVDVAIDQGGCAETSKPPRIRIRPSELPTYSTTVCRICPG